MRLPFVTHPRKARHRGASSELTFREPYMGNIPREEEGCLKNCADNDQSMLGSSSEESLGSKAQAAVHPREKGEQKSLRNPPR